MPNFGTKKTVDLKERKGMLRSGFALWIWKAAPFFYISLIIVHLKGSFSFALEIDEGGQVP